VPLVVGAGLAPVSSGARFGVGARARHYKQLLAEPIAVDLLEVVTEDYLVAQSANRDVLRRLRDQRSISLHGVSLNIGSIDPLSEEYLAQVRALVDEIEPELVSDHLSWGTFDGRASHDLLPMPLTEEALAHVVPRVVEVQERLGCRILLENVSSYTAFHGAELSEWAFLSEVARRADAGILLDVNNVYVNARNLGIDPERFIDEIDAARVAELHLAGHRECGTHLLDTHDRLVAEPVWALYARAVRRLGPRPTLIEWDANVPTLEVLLGESRRAAQVAAEARRAGT
jgi:uncharacterized protein (UPF0276 family)